MESVRVRALMCLCACLCAWSALCRGQVMEKRRNDDGGGGGGEGGEGGFHINNLQQALQTLMDEADDRLSVQKKASLIPRCDVGERCAMKHGPRIGRLCDCLRGTACNSFFLRCY